MVKKRGGQQKPPDEVKGRYLQLRVTQPEKDGFDAAAELAGLSLAAWVRERLRVASRNELQEVGEPIPFHPRGRNAT